MKWFGEHHPEVVIVAAAKVGGIMANKTYPADFIHENLAIATNIMQAAYLRSATKLLFLGSNCVYPKMAPQPIREDSLLTGPLEPTNEPYAVAKIAGIKMAEAYHRQHGCDFFSAMPVNLYGPGDNFDLERCHLLPALIRKCHEAKEDGQRPVTLFGDGTPRRETMHADDVADAILYLLTHASARDGSLWNIGTGFDQTIAEIATTVQAVIGHTGEIQWQTDKPNGTPGKLLSTKKLRDLGWFPRISLEAGIRKTYSWYLENRT